MTILNKIAEFRDNQKQKYLQNIRNSAALEVLKNFNYEKEKNEILSIKNCTVDEFIIKDMSSIFQAETSSSIDNCPICHSKLLEIKGTEYYELQCYNFPKCQFHKPL